MKIKEITEEKIIFDNGTEISYYHDQKTHEATIILDNGTEVICRYNDHSGENVYADFNHLKDAWKSLLLGGDHEYPEDIQIEVVKDSGFRFGGPSGWQFIPCYNHGDEFSSSDLDIIITYPDKKTKTINMNDGIQHFIYE